MLIVKFNEQCNVWESSERSGKRSVVLLAIKQDAGNVLENRRNLLFFMVLLLHIF